MTAIDSHETNLLLDRAAEGDRSAIGGLLERHRADLRRAVDLRLAARLRKRVDASDIVQEAELEAFERLPDYLARRPMPFRHWLRKTALSAAASAQIYRQLVNVADSPGRQAMQRDLIKQVNAALGDLSEAEREILLMRHVEKLTNVEIGHLLDLAPSAVSKRHVRCLVRLRSMLHQRGIEMSGP